MHYVSILHILEQNALNRTRLCLKIKSYFVLFPYSKFLDPAPRTIADLSKEKDQRAMISYNYFSFHTPNPFEMVNYSDLWGILPIAQLTNK